MEKLSLIIIKYLEKINIKLNTLIFNKIEMDSKKIEEGDIFFAINNGNNFILDVLKKKPSLIISDLKKNRIIDPKIIYVESTVETMQNLAVLYRASLKTKVIGITGSNGKTTTKDILYSILSSQFKVKKTVGNHNNHIGLPFTILRTEKETEFLILEMGMSDLGEIDFLCKISKPDYAIITNIGISHIEILGNKENIFKAKSEILKYVKKENIFISGDDEYLKKLEGNKVGFVNGDFLISNFSENTQGMNFTFEKNKYMIKLNGTYVAIDTALCISLSFLIGMSPKKIQEGLDICTLTPMRFQKVFWKGFLCINDAYNASPVSMNLGLETFNKIYVDNYKIVILGDMLELGEKELEYHMLVIEKALIFDKIYLFGKRMEKALKKLKINNEKIEHIESKDLLAKNLKILLNKKTIDEKIPVLFLKASRGIKLEEILEY
ncbi:MAG: UDP-N-acetylmuramoyl-tripeptide--D-alanyl-D-alanine ligase [Fusobacteriaceae bacterium]